MNPPDIEAHAVIIKLAIGYTLLGAFIIVVILTLLALVGIPVLKEPEHRKKLINILIVEVAIGCVAIFFGFMNVSPEKAVEEIKEPYEEEIKVHKATKQELTKQIAQQDREKAALVDRTKSEIARLKDQVRIIDDKKKQYLARIEKLEKTLAHNKSELESSVKALAKIHSVLGDPNLVQQKVKRMEATTKHLNRELEAEMAKNANLNVQLDRAKARIRALQAQR